MANINRDYLIVLDAKTSVVSDTDKLTFYISDNNSPNIFVNLVVKDSDSKLSSYVDVHDPKNYKLQLHIVKPTNEIVHPAIEGKLVSEKDALYLFKLPVDAVNAIGRYKCELRVNYADNDSTTTTTSDKFKYKVKKSIYNDLDTVKEAPEYPVVLQLLEKLDDIGKYEADRRLAELAREVAEQERTNTFNVMKSDIANSIQTIDNKVVDIENRTTEMKDNVTHETQEMKNTLDNYKAEKDLEIDTYVANKNKELDRYVATKNNDIDNYKKAKDLLIGDKLKEVDASEKSRAEAETLRQQQHTEREAYGWEYS